MQNKVFLKRPVALALALILIFTACSALLFSVEVSADDSQNYKNELWMKLDYNYKMSKGVRSIIVSSGAGKPHLDGGNYYMPITPFYSFTGNPSPTKSGSTLSVSAGSDVYLLTENSTSVSKNGREDTALSARMKKSDGIYYITFEDAKRIYGLNSFFNPDIGLFVFSKDTITYDTSFASLATQIANIDGLIYDLPSASEIIPLMTDNLGSLKEHPRLLCDQGRFDELSVIYKSDGGGLSDEGKTLKSWMDAYMAEANAYLTAYFSVSAGRAQWKSSDAKNHFRQPYFLYDENGNRLEGYYDEDKIYHPAYSYTYPGDTTPTTLVDVYDGVNNAPWDKSGVNGDGYDYGGRSDLKLVSVYLKYFAFAWQMTGEDKWVDAFCLLATELGKWQHWGEAHTLDLCDGAVEFAIGYDWIYNGLSASQRTELASILFLKAVEVGDKCTSLYASSSAPWWRYTSALDGSQRQLRQAGSGRTAWDTRKRTENWQQVCTSGYVMSALAIMDEFPTNTAATAVCTGLIERLLPCINNAMLENAPDGSYLEAPGYWSYSTNTFVRMITSLVNTLGDDFGFLDTVGLHNSFYYAVSIADNSFKYWNYHDGGSTLPDAQYFYCASRLFNDPNIAYYRDLLLGGDYGAKYDIMDIIFYDEDLSTGGGNTNTLDYRGLNIETVTMRSSWGDKNGIFTGIHAGANQSAHSDADSGSFYLTAGGINWFYDPGSENYNIGTAGQNQYFDYENHRYFFYRKSAVAHSTVIVLDDTQEELRKYGQVLNTRDEPYARITTLHSEKDGAYAIADMAPQYGQYCTSARRAVMLTEGRTAVVLQDEIGFSRPSDIVWTGVCRHFYKISPDGRTAYLRTPSSFSDRKLLRVSLVSPDEALRFEYVTDELFLDTVRVKSDTLPLGSNPNGRLVIRASDKTDIKIGVVFELINSEADPLFYEYTPTSDWKITDKTVLEGDNSGGAGGSQTAYDYTEADLRAILAKIKVEIRPMRKSELIIEALKITKSIDKSDLGVINALVELDSYVNAQNELISRANKAAEESFFGNLKLFLKIK